MIFLTQLGNQGGIGVYGFYGAFCMFNKMLQGRSYGFYTIKKQDESSKTQRRQHVCPSSNQSNDVIEPHMMKPQQDPLNKAPSKERKEEQRYWIQVQTTRAKPKHGHKGGKGTSYVFQSPHQWQVACWKGMETSKSSKPRRALTCNEHTSQNQNSNCSIQSYQHPLPIEFCARIMNFHK